MLNLTFNEWNKKKDNATCIERAYHLDHHPSKKRTEWEGHCREHVHLFQYSSKQCQHGVGISALPSILSHGSNSSPPSSHLVELVESSWFHLCERLLVSVYNKREESQGIYNCWYSMCRGLMTNETFYQCLIHTKSR